MKEEAQRIAIAEACGWKIENYGPPGNEQLYWRLRQPDGKVRCAECTGEEFSRLQFALMVPNFTGSLDAMHEAEKVLKDQQWPIYLNRLEEVTGAQEHGSWWECLRSAHHATAPQRAEAFLRTLDKWEEQP